MAKDSTNTALLVVGGLAVIGVVWFLSQPKAGSSAPIIIRSNPPVNSGNSTAAEIAAGGTAAAAILQQLGDAGDL